MDKNKLMIFENPEFGQIRSMLMNGEPWFVAADVCKALGLTQTSRAMAKLDDDEGGLLQVPHPQKPELTMEVNCVNEPGLYTLVLTSRKPDAKTFRRWITHEVIPSIRKNGTYMTDAVIEQLDENPELVPEYLNHLRNQNAAARELREQLALVQPKAEYYDSFVKISDLTCFRYTAKELGVPQKKLMGYLVEHGYLFRDRHRGDRAFARAGKRNDPLFCTRDFYTKGGEKSEYTLITPAGKEHLKGLVTAIADWVPSEKDEVTVGELVTNAAVFAE